MELVSDQQLLVLIIALIGLVMAVLGFLTIWILISITTLFLLSQNEKENERKKRTAAIAVAVALAENQKLTKSQFPLPSTAIVSAWQAVLRSNILNKRGRVR